MFSLSQPDASAAGGEGAGGADHMVRGCSGRFSGSSAAPAAATAAAAPHAAREEGGALREAPADAARVAPADAAPAAPAAPVAAPPAAPVAATAAAPAAVAAAPAAAAAAAAPSPGAAAPASEEAAAAMMPPLFSDAYYATRGGGTGAGNSRHCAYPYRDALTGMPIHIVLATKLEYNNPLFPDRCGKYDV